VTRVGAGGLANAGATPVATKQLPARSKAYDLYIRGKVKAGSENPDDNAGAIKALEAAVAIDPFFAAGYAQLARAYNTRAFKFSSQSQGKAFRENADVAVAKALDLNPDLAEAHFARGLILWTKAKGFPHEQAIKAFKRSLELNPHADETHHQLSMVYSHVGLLDQAQEHVRAAVDINPNNTMARFRVGVYTAWQCRFEAALAILKTVPSDVSPMLIDRVRAEVLVQLGRREDARTVVDEYLSRHPRDAGGSFTSVRALLLAKEAKSQETRELIARAISIGKDFGHFHHTAYNIASAWAALNRPDEAVKWLEAAADDGFPCYLYFEADPNLEPLRGYPRFTALMSTLRQQWQRFARIAPHRKSLVVGLPTIARPTAWK
jgi:tetratricopeptide (TPR) repeat protein